jgi:hypothetical protein
MIMYKMLFDLSFMPSVCSLSVKFIYNVNNVLKSPSITAQTVYIVIG